MPERTFEQNSSSPPPAILRITLLGTPAARWAGHAVAISRRQVRALLFRLAASREPIPREHLCFLFWPDIPETASRRKLSGLLAHLRRTLPSPSILLTRDDHVGLDPEHVWSDLVAFEALCGGQPSSADETALQEAVTLYRGPFLDGFSLPDGPEYESWMQVERGACERLYLEALMVLIGRATAHGQYDTAIAHAQRYLETDNLAEEIHRRLIELYAATGGRSAAIRQYENCAAVLEHELGVEPLPGTQAAFQAALESTGPLPPGAVSLPDLGDRPKVELAWTTWPGLEAELVGRENALQQLADTITFDHEGLGRIVLISGEPGIGKSRLMQEFATGLGTRALVMMGTGYPDTQASPYQPLLEALRPAVLAYHSRLDLPEWCHAEACRLIPELHSLHPGLPPSVAAGSEQAQATLFEALYQLLLSLAAVQQPILLCLDDLHWASETTLDWLVYVGRQLAHDSHPGILILGAYRSEENGALTPLRQGLSRQGALTELTLIGLDEDEIRQLLGPLQRSIPCDEDLVGYLRKATGGNPFFLLESVRSIIETGCQVDDLATPEDMYLPDTILDAVEARVARLSPTARQVLEAGAVLGRAFSFTLAQQTSGRGEMETVDALDEVVRHQLVEEGATGYWFKHELIRAAVLHQLSRRRQEVLHRRAGQAIERMEPRSVAALARHFERAGEAGRAAPYALQAGRVAKEVFAHVEAQAHFDKALELLEWEAVDLQEPEALIANERLRVEVLFERGWALRLVGDMEAYARDGEEVVRLASSLGDPRSLAHARWREAYAHRWFCRFSKAQASAEEGVRLSQTAEEPMLEAMCRREVGLSARATGDYDLARIELQRALQLFARLGETVYEIHSMGNLATLSWYEKDYSQALGLAEQALKLCEAAGLHHERRLPLGDMGAAAVALGAEVLARQYLDESLSIAREADDRTQEILCLTHLGWLCIRLNRPEEAIHHLQASLAVAQEISSCTEQSWLLSGLAEAYRLTGQQDKASQCGQSALTLAEETGAAYDQRLAYSVLIKLKNA